LAKNLKLTIKNTQIAQAVNLSSLKSKLASKKAGQPEEPVEQAQTIEKQALEKEKLTKSKTLKSKPLPLSKEAAPIGEVKPEAPRIKARSRSAFAEPLPGEPIGGEQVEEEHVEDYVEDISPHSMQGEDDYLGDHAKTQYLSESPLQEQTAFDDESALGGRRKSSHELRQEIFGEEIKEQKLEQQHALHKNPLLAPIEKEQTHDVSPAKSIVEKPLVEKQPLKPIAKDEKAESKPEIKKPFKQTRPLGPPPKLLPSIAQSSRTQNPYARDESTPPPPKLGPTGRHVSELAPKERPQEPSSTARSGATGQERQRTTHAQSTTGKPLSDVERADRFKKGLEPAGPTSATDDDKKAVKGSKYKEFRDIKPTKQTASSKFDARDRQGLREGDEESHWRKRKMPKQRQIQEEVIRPTSLQVHIPISLKDLASEMKLKASQLVAKLFAQGLAVTLNDLLEDETTIQLLGHEFGCEITIDTREEERIRITDKTIKDEVAGAKPESLIIRPPVVTFMGHVDHGKTSLIDAIRKSNRAAGEAGAITQHMGAFSCHTAVGDITILDTPGHEAFSAMRARGADVTDIVVLVVAGDEGVRQQTLEALQHAKAAKVTIVVAINKCDKPNFNAENVYRQLADNELLPEAWGGQTITINCSAVTGQGISELLEMLAIQAEVLELKADKETRARGTVLESEMHKGMGAIATVLVQNGTLRLGDAVVFSQLWGRIKTMRNEFGQELTEAGPSTPVEVTGLSGLPEAGQEFIVVKNEKEAREIAEARMLGMRQFNLLQTKKLSMENLFQQASETNKKILNVILRADVQGTLEALKAALMKIESKKAELNIIFTGVGEISESDVQLAAASKALIVGFHSQIESHAEDLIKQLGVQTRIHDIIYHAIDDVKSILSGLLDKIATETEHGRLEVKAVFKSSHHGMIAGCQVSEGTVKRKDPVRIRRGNEIVWKGSIASLKRVKEDVREVTKGLECGVLLNNYNDVSVGDIIESYEVTYITQEL